MQPLPRKRRLLHTGHGSLHVGHQLEWHSKLGKRDVATGHRVWLNFKASMRAFGTDGMQFPHVSAIYWLVSNALDVLTLLFLVFFSLFLEFSAWAKATNQTIEGPSKETWKSFPQRVVSVMCQSPWACMQLYTNMHSRNNSWTD